MNDPVSSQQHSAKQNPLEQSGRKSPWTLRRILAWIGILLLLFLYAATFVSAVLSSPGAGRLFRFCVGMTIVVPVFIWILCWAAGKLPGRKAPEKEEPEESLQVPPDDLR